MNGFLSHTCDLVSVGDRDNVYYCLETLDNGDTTETITEVIEREKRTKRQCAVRR